MLRAVLAASAIVSPAPCNAPLRLKIACGSLEYWMSETGNAKACAKGQDLSCEEGLARTLLCEARVHRVGNRPLSHCRRRSPGRSPRAGERSRGSASASSRPVPKMRGALWRAPPRRGHVNIPTTPSTQHTQTNRPSSATRPLESSMPACIMTIVVRHQVHRLFVFMRIVVGCIVVVIRIVVTSTVDDVVIVSFRSCCPQLTALVCLQCRCQLMTPPIKKCLHPWLE